MILNNYPVLIRHPTVKSKILIHTEEELIEFINKHNGKKNIFVNLYHYYLSECCSTVYFFDKERNKFVCSNCNQILRGFDLKSFIIDSVVFDIDPTPITEINKKKAFIKVKRYYHYFKKYETYMMKSGKGFHFYVRTIPLREKDFEYSAKNAIKNFQIKTEKKLGYSDPTTHGDTSQMIRVPGTFNIRSRSFCTCLSDFHLKFSFKKLTKLAKIQPLIKVWPINKGIKLNLKNYDSEIDVQEYIHEGELSIDVVPQKNKIETYKKILKYYNVDYDSLGECVKIMLNNEFLGFRERYLLINVLKNFGLSELDTEKIMRISLFSEPDASDLNENKRYNWAEHCINGERQIYYVYHTPYGIPSCKSGTMLGFKALHVCDSCKSKDIMSFRKKRNI